MQLNERLMKHFLFIPHPTVFQLNTSTRATLAVYSSPLQSLFKDKFHTFAFFEHLTIKNLITLKTSNIMTHKKKLKRAKKTKKQTS